jgi:hypothetical protein
VDERNNWHVVDPLWSTEGTSVDFINNEVEVTSAFTAVEAFRLTIDTVTGAASDDMDAFEVLGRWPSIGGCAE